MRDSHYADPPYEAETNVEADILTFFSSDTAAAIRQHTCSALAKDLNISSEALEQIIANRPSCKSRLGVRFFMRRGQQFA